ncbi:MAG: hypothetical protein A2806_00435 [Candidatus Terrybacteria bacterium RIFCSPHIGHO2_01_FULL_48_17]|uniref:Uncharacterized protein n=1 Tax=Candidatus Terrybacteria bacterium RIFCSPHIGHO2_01_FULL_48_17 TaxID=1802362 RepID=A0A1G2PLW8_9BACT|nr:MAG: hypothetical protein A2806_00435 [Candidatus Terrybacteria bacterium RIFCSPHIGHO2_01_FULL_48_17]
MPFLSPACGGIFHFNSFNELAVIIAVIPKKSTPHPKGEGDTYSLFPTPYSLFLRRRRANLRKNSLGLAVGSLMKIIYGGGEFFRMVRELLP